MSHDISNLWTVLSCKYENEWMKAAFYLFMTALCSAFPILSSDFVSVIILFVPYDFLLVFGFYEITKRHWFLKRVCSQISDHSPFIIWKPGVLWIRVRQREIRDFLITQQEALPALLHHTPHWDMHKHNKWMLRRGSHGCRQVWIPAEQDHLSCITQTSRQPIERLGCESQRQWGREILSQYGWESSVIHSSLETGTRTQTLAHSVTR